MLLSSIECSVYCSRDQILFVSQLDIMHVSNLTKPVSLPGGDKQQKHSLMMCLGYQFLLLYQVKNLDNVTQLLRSLLYYYNYYEQ